MNNLVEQLNSIKDMDDFIRFVIELALDAKDHPDEWKNKTITDYLGELGNWIDDEYMFDKEIDWDNLDYKSFAKILYMGKIYESNVEG